MWEEIREQDCTREPAEAATLPESFFIYLQHWDMLKQWARRIDLSTTTNGEGKKKKTPRFFFFFVLRQTWLIINPPGPHLWQTWVCMSITELKLRQQKRKWDWHNVSTIHSTRATFRIWKLKVFRLFMHNSQVLGSRQWQTLHVLIYRLCEISKMTATATFSVSLAQKKIAFLPQGQPEKQHICRDGMVFSFISRHIGVSLL